MDNFKEAIFSSVPFLSLLSAEVPKNRPLLTRLSEQTIVGVVAAFVALQTMQARQEEQISALRRTVERQERQTEEARRELREEIATMKRDLYTPKK